MKLKPLKNFSQIGKRIATIAATPPTAPLRGRGNARVEITEPLVFARLMVLAPEHCETITSREATNRFGKLGYAPHYYVSPELGAVVDANAGDFRRLDLAMRTVKDSGL